MLFRSKTAWAEARGAWFCLFALLGCGGSGPTRSDEPLQDEPDPESASEAEPADMNGSEATPPGSGLEPVRVIRGDANASDWWDLGLRGEGLEAHEGQRVTVRIGMPERSPERLGSAQVRVVDGGFALLFPAVWEASLYKRKLVHIDADGDGVCSPTSDLLFEDWRGNLTPELLVRLPPDAPHSMRPTSEGCTVIDSEWPRE